MVTYHTVFVEPSGKYYMYELGVKYYVSLVRDLSPIGDEPTGEFVTGIGVSFPAIVKHDKNESEI